MRSAAVLGALAAVSAALAPLLADEAAAQRRNAGLEATATAAAATSSLASRWRCLLVLRLLIWHLRGSLLVVSLLLTASTFRQQTCRVPIPIK